MTDIIPSKILHPAEIVQFPLNSNSHPPAQVEELVASRQRFSQYRNVVIWTCPADIETADANGQPVTLKKGIAYVLAGNGFHLASLKRQDEAIEVKDYSHLTLDEAILLAETDNAAPLGAQRMVEQLRANLERARSLYVNDERMSRMFERLRGQVGLNGHTSKDAEPQIDKAAILREQWGVELGQIWELGQHRLVCGDCTDRAVVEAVMRGEEADCLCWDPPFNVGFDYDGEFKGEDSKTPEDYKKWLNLCLKNCDAILANLHTCFVWQGMPNIRYFADWFNQYDWRLISIAKGFVQARPTWLQWATDPVIAWSSDKSERPISQRDFFYNGQSANTKQTSDRILSGYHPCPRSIEVVEYFIDGWTKDNSAVIDICSGSGTTLIAAENLNRRCRAVEVDPGYVAVTLQRFLDSTGIEPKRVD